MKTILLTVGRARAPFAAADAHYRRLLARHVKLDVVEARNNAELLRRLPERARIVALDREGNQMDSMGWSRWLGERRLEARDVWILIGGPEGLPAAALEAAQERLSLGPQTMAHQLARVVLLEQLFRAAKIAAGERYHH